MCAHVLVAEDDEKQAELIRRSLLAEGHTATVVHDGAAALDAARRLRPDLLVLDLMLPVLDGFDVCRRLRGDDGEPTVPVVMLTARSGEDDLLLGLDLPRRRSTPSPSAANAWRPSARPWSATSRTNCAAR